MNRLDRSIYENLNLLPEDLSGWNGNLPTFGKLIEEIKPSIIIEVGSWKGQSTINMGKKVKELNLDCKIYCIDTWLGALEFLTHMDYSAQRDLLLKNGYPQIYYQFLSNVVHNSLEDHITPIPTTSDIGHRYFKHTNIMADLIYIDASHEETDVYRDLENYFQLLKPNCTMFGDDYFPWPGVKKSVDRFVKEYDLELIILDDHFWSVKKSDKKNLI